MFSFRKRTSIRLFPLAIFIVSSTGIAQSLPEVRRLEGNPIVRPEMLPGHDGENINGPSLIRVPDWVAEPLGRYYLYFAHHAGTYIRLAYADHIQGPWTVYEPGTLRLEDTVCNDIKESSYANYRHVASPDVHIDEDAREILMYFHCPVYMGGPKHEDDSYRQVTLLATSVDGLTFTAGSEPLGNSYFRVFREGGFVYALGMPGVIYRSVDGRSGFARGPTLFGHDMRHAAVKVDGDRLRVLYTNVGQNPERILYTEVDLRHDWMSWREGESLDLLAPETDWEGAGEPAVASERGFVMGPARQLRDPAIFEEDGRSWLLYSVAGEAGIALAEIDWN